MESSGLGAAPVKGMIRHRDTEQYYQGNGEWTKNPREAMQFENLFQVVEEAKRNNLSDKCEFVVETNGEIGFRLLLPL